MDMHDLENIRKFSDSFNLLRINAKKNNLISDIKYDNASWSFDGKTVKKFDHHIQQSIPLYDLAHDLTLKFSDFLSEKSTIYDLGCSTGTFLSLISKRHKKRNINLLE